MKNVLAIAAVAALVFVVGCGKAEEKSVKSDGINGGGESNEDTGAAFEQWHGQVRVLEINFRTEPDTEAPQVPGCGVLYYGTEFDVVAEKGDWLKTRLYDGTEGWLRSGYEGERYVWENEEFKEDEDRLIGSKEFFDFAEKEARRWDGDARLAFLCGNRGGLEGKCLEWIAFYKSPGKPGKKLMCAYNAPMRMENGLLAEEWDADWIMKGEVENPGVAPGPFWWDHKDYSVSSTDFVTSTELCSPENVRRIISTHKGTISKEMGDAVKVYPAGEFRFFLNRGEWIIAVFVHGGDGGEFLTGEYLFVHDAPTGQFKEFRDEVEAWDE